MELYNELNKLVEGLVIFDMNTGVTPIELASNIYEEGYSEIKMSKKFGLIECSVCFYDLDYFSEKKLKFEYRYYYDIDNVLKEIVQIQCKKFTLLWSREEERNKLINNILKVANEANINLENLLSSDNLKRIRSYIGA